VRTVPWRCTTPSRVSTSTATRALHPLDPLFLDYEGAAVVFLAEGDEAAGTLGIRFDAERETPETADIFSDLRMEADAHPTRPLFQGRRE
jgi:hypothetical protein